MVNQSLLRILTYHRVADPTSSHHLDPRLISATPKAFAVQMRYLARNYNVVAMGQVLDAIAGKRSLPQRSVLITFDDGYRDFGEIAWPILRHYRLPATVFVATAFPDNPKRSFWWDRIYRAFSCATLSSVEVALIGRIALGSAQECQHSLAKVKALLKALPHDQAMTLVDDLCRCVGAPSGAFPAVLSWEELRRLAKEGVTLGSHTQAHALMTRLSHVEAREDLRKSFRDLKREIGDVLPIFCYPDGAHNDSTREVLESEGVLLALTTADGHNLLGSAGLDPLCLKRTNVTPRTSPIVFRIRLLRWASRIDAWRHSRKKSRLEIRPEQAGIARVLTGIPNN